MIRQSPLLGLVRRARRRCVWNVLFDHSTRAASAALLALLLMLFAGTQVLDWGWLLVAALGGLAAAAYGFRGRIPSPYRAAQIVDRNLAKRDTFATAFFFHGLTNGHKYSAQVRDAQRKTADHAATAVDLRRAVPLRLPRALYLAALLAALSGGLLALRYGVTRGLSLRPPLVNLAFDSFRLTPVRETAQRKSPAQQVIDEQLRKMGVPVEQLSAGAASDANTRYDAGKAEPAPEGSELAPPDNPSAEKGENSEASDSATSGADAPAQAAAHSDQPPPGESNSLLDKMRDAMANLLAKMKIQPPPGLGSRSVTSAKAAKPGARQQGSRAEKGSPGPGEQSAEGAPSPDQQAGQPGEGQQMARGAQGDQARQGIQRPSSEDGKSGIGRQDGDKSLREAQQLAAMGKLSQILGRRTSEITGQIMVEVKSGKQDLKTQYSQKAADHANSGGELHRDEVPLLYQQYVQHYFEQIHKSGAAPPTSGQPPGRP